MRLVENNERIVQRSPAHEGNRSNLDDILLQISVDLFGIEHVVQGVVQGTEIGIDLVLKRPREKSQALSRLHGRTRQNNSIHALG